MAHKRPPQVGTKPHDVNPNETAKLRSRAGGAALWSLGNAMFVRLVGVASGVVLARLIVPEQFGVFATALVVFTILISVSEMGVSVALVRMTGDISKIAPTVTSLSLVSSGLLGILCFGVAPSFAKWMNAPESSGVLQLMAIGLPLAGLSAVPGAITTRNFRQDKKALAEAMAAVVSVGVGVGLALFGLGAWALGWSRLAALLTTVIVLILVTKERYRPGFDAAEARALIAFGAPLAGSSLLVLAVMNVDNVVVGRVLGTEPLGFYSLAFNLSAWPVVVLSAPARNVSVAWFSNLRDQGHEPEYGFAQLFRPLMLITIPACVGIAVIAQPLVEIVYGDVWLPAAAPLGILAALGALRVAMEVFYDSLVSSGDTRKILIIHMTWLVLLVPALYVGADRFGLVGLSVAHVCVVVFAVSPLYLWSMRGLGVSPRTVGRLLLRPIIGGVLMLVTGLGLRQLMQGALIQLLVCGGASFLVYVIVAVPHPKQAITTLLALQNRVG